MTTVDKLPRTVLVLVAPVAFDPLNVVIVTYSVSSVTLHVELYQNICFSPGLSSAITQAEQLASTAIEEGNGVGALVIVPEEIVVDIEFAVTGTDSLIRCWLHGKAMVHLLD